jgi:hypothetical protein
VKLKRRNSRDGRYLHEPLASRDDTAAVVTSVPEDIVRLVHGEPTMTETQTVTMWA